MLESITWNDLLLAAFFIVFILVVAALFYLIRFLISIEKGASILQRLLKNNEKNIDSTLKNMPRLTNEVSELTKSTNSQMSVLKDTIYNVNDIFKDDFLKKTKSIYEIIYLLIRTFLYDNEDEKKKNRDDFKVEQ